MSGLAKSVLVVDDEPDILSTITTLLKKHGYQVHGFNDPREALAHSKGCNECGIAITDVRMTGMTGFQLARAIKQLHPYIKIVFMSSFEINPSEWRMTLPSTAIDHFLTKPFSAAQLIQTVEKCTPQTKSISKVSLSAEQLEQSSSKFGSP